MKYYTYICNINNNKNKKIMTTEFLNQEDVRFANAERACYFIKTVLEDTNENDELDRCAADMLQADLLKEIFYK